MITSGLVLTLNADAALAEQAMTSLHTRPEFTSGERNDRWLPVALEAADDAASRAAHDWLNSLPGVDFVDVVHVNFEGEEAEGKNGGNARPHPDPLPRGEGTAIVHSSVLGNAFAQSHRRSSSETANGSPSPGGEGRGEGGRQTNRPPQSKAPTVAAGIPACRRAGASLPGGENAAAKQDLEKPVSRSDGKVRSGRLEARPLRQAKMPAATQPRGDL
jgi:hypothetical protein